jgi:hypothetical protein
MAPAYRPDLADGWLDIRVIEATVRARSRLTAAVLTGTLGRSRVYRSRLARSVDVRAAAGQPIRVCQVLARLDADFRDKAPLSAAEAAAVILNGVRDGDWRILIGEDAKMIDAAVRAKPDAAYDYAGLFSAWQASGTDENT